MPIAVFLLTARNLQYVDVNNSIILSVDLLSPDKLYGKTANPAMLIKNTEISKPLIARDSRFNELLFKAGRYIAIFVASNESNYGMLYLDFEKDIDKALSFRSKFLKGAESDLFMYVFNQTVESYEQDYDEVELLLDESFGNPFVESVN